MRGPSDLPVDRRDWVRELIGRYLESLAEDGIHLCCPVCRWDHLEPSTLEAASEYDFTELSTVGFDSRIVPRAVVVCTRCGHLLEFAWAPILELAQTEGWV